MGRKQSNSNTDVDIFQPHTCTNCDLHIYNRGVATGGGGQTCSVLFVKDISSTLESTNGIAFTSRSSKIIINMIKNYRMLDYSTFANLIQCRTQVFSEYDYSNCKHNIINLIKTIKPLIIVTFGKTAYENISGNTTGFKRNLYKIKPIGSRFILPLEHLYLINKDVDVLARTLTAFNAVSIYLNLIHPQHIPVSYDYSEYIRI